MIGTLFYTVNETFGTAPRSFVSISATVQNVTGIIVIENVFFFLVHKAFHEVKGLWWAHRFHHRFNDVILPSSASAVSVTEYVVGYVLPLLLGAKVMKADEPSIQIAAALISISNLLIHSPFLEGKVYPSWLLVSADDHYRHHRKLTTDYAAPIINCDRIIQSVGKKMS